MTKHLWKNRRHPRGMLGKHHSIAAKKKMSIARKGKNSHWIKDKHHTEESKRKMSENRKGLCIGKENHNYGKHLSVKTRKKLSKALKGRKQPFRSEEYRRNLSIALTGKKKSEETKRKLRAYTGKRTSNWQGGKSFEPYGFEFNNFLRNFIRNRDNYRCQECKKHQSKNFTKSGKNIKLTTHHIDYSKYNNKPENLISLCLHCHMKTNFSRKDWTEYFREKITIKKEIKKRKKIVCDQ
jgi:hypothetical protein